MRSSLAESCFVAVFKRPNQSFLKDSRLSSDTSQAIRECNPSSSEVAGNMLENPIEWNLCGGDCSVHRSRSSFAWRITSASTVINVIPG